MSRLRRVWHPQISGEGSRLDLDPEESHHALHVLRLRAGDPVAVFDGAGREWDATIDSAERGRVRLEVGTERTDPVEPPLAVEIFQGICRPDRMEWAIQKATEVGAAAIRPVLSRRSKSPAPTPDRLGRWRRIAREACKQCGRRRVPWVDDAVEEVPAPPEGGLGVLLCAAGDARPLAEILAGPPSPAVWILAGPEGGLEPDERQALADRGWKPVSLGPRILRTETAGVVACALVLHAWGDLGGRPPRERGQARSG